MKIEDTFGKKASTLASTQVQKEIDAVLAEQKLHLFDQVVSVHKPGHKNLPPEESDVDKPRLDPAIAKMIEKEEAVLRKKAAQ